MYCSIFSELQNNEKRETRTFVSYKEHSAVLYGDSGHVDTDSISGGSEEMSASL